MNGACYFFHKLTYDYINSTVTTDYHLGFYCLSFNFLYIRYLSPCVIPVKNHMQTCNDLLFCLLLLYNTDMTIHIF